MENIRQSRVRKATENAIKFMLESRRANSTASVVAARMSQLQARFGPEFDPIRGLEDLILTATNLREDIKERLNITPGVTRT